MKDQPKLYCDSPIQDQAPYQEPPLEEYLESAGYPKDSGEPIAKRASATIFNLRDHKR